MEKAFICDLKVDDTGKIFANVNANEVTVLDGNDVEEDDSFSHIKVGVEVHYTPEDDVHGKALKAKIIKVRKQYKVKKIQSKKKVVKPTYELTVRPNKLAPPAQQKKSVKAIKGK